jgi:hypothetical protein
MRRMARHMVIGLVLLASSAWAMAAIAATLSPEYLTGRWTTGPVENCGRAEHEQTVFRDDGTFATEYSAQALAVGFWRVEDDRIELQILSTEAYLPQSLQESLPGDYHALQGNGLAFDITDNAFRMVQLVASELRGVDMMRCPAS